MPPDLAVVNRSLHGDRKEHQSRPEQVKSSGYPDHPTSCARPPPSSRVCSFHYSRDSPALAYYDSLEQQALDLSAQGLHRQALHIFKRALYELHPHNIHEWTRYLSLRHSLGSVLVSCEDFVEAAKVFASIMLVGVGYTEPKLSSYGVGTQQDVCQPHERDIPYLISQILSLYKSEGVLVDPNTAANCKNRLFADAQGQLPLARNLSLAAAQNAANHPQAKLTRQALKTFCSPVELIVSNALLNLAKLLQDGVNSGSPSKIVYLDGCAPTTSSIFALYILSFSFNPSPSAANNIGILLASMLNEIPAKRYKSDLNGRSPAVPTTEHESTTESLLDGSDSDCSSKSSFQFDSDNSLSSTSTRDSVPAVCSASRIRQLAFEYYQSGLYLDSNHPHLYTNLGSLLRQEGRVNEAIQTYEQAIKCDPHFAIALANLASCLKDQGCIDQAAAYYYRAVQQNGNFPEAVAGLANCFGIVCQWAGRGSYGWEVVGVDDHDNLIHGSLDGWVPKVVKVAVDQIEEARNWGVGVINFVVKMENGRLFQEIPYLPPDLSGDSSTLVPTPWNEWSGHKDEGEKIMSLIEQNTKQKQWEWYADRLEGRQVNPEKYLRARIPAMLVTPLATTILPFHAFTLPFDSDQVRVISEKCATRISVSTLTQSWVPRSVYPPPEPPVNGVLKVAYVSSDFTNHPLAHLMQNVFGFHDTSKVLAHAYSTSPSDGSQYHEKIKQESYVFRDVSVWSIGDIANQLVADGIHVLVNLNGFTKGARNEIFALRPCPVQICLMGFAGPMGANWIDYILGDKIATPVTNEYNRSYTPYRKEKIIYMPDTLFCCDHRQSAPDARGSQEHRHNWPVEVQLRQQLRRVIFPNLHADWFLMANFNQLYKIDPVTFAVWLRILCRLPHSYLWLLQFPKSGQENLLRFARKWTGGRQDVVDRIIFTTVADKDAHIIRSRVCDLVLDTPECNAHTTAVDIMWSSTPMVTYARHFHKLCSRISSSIVSAAFPGTPQGRAMCSRLMVSSEQEYEQRAVELGATYEGRRELDDMRRCLFEHRFESKLFDTKMYVENLEKGYLLAWNNWLEKRHEDIYI